MIEKGRGPGRRAVVEERVMRMMDEMDRLRDSGFQRLMQEPLYQVGLSMVPAGDVPGVLKNLLRATYDAGFNSATAAVLRELDRDRRENGR